MLRREITLRFWNPEKENADPNRKPYLSKPYLLDSTMQNLEPYGGMSFLFLFFFFFSFSFGGTLWHELKLDMNVGPCSARKLAKLLEGQHIFEHLVGVNPEYEAIRASVTSQDPQPPIGTVFAFCTSSRWKKAEEKSCQ